MRKFSFFKIKKKMQSASYLETSWNLYKLIISNFNQREISSSDYSFPPAVLQNAENSKRGKCPFYIPFRKNNIFLPQTF